MKGTVYRSTGSWYIVKTEDGSFIEARLRGKMKTDDFTSTNPVAVGDQVLLEKDEQGDIMITDIQTRKNYIIRQSPQNKNMQHIMAANIDQSLLMASIRNPKTSTGFIDRFLVASEAFHVPAILVFNKKDLYQEKDIRQYDKIKSMYQKAGYPVMLVSVTENKGLRILKNVLRGKRTLVSGHSGVGKSSLINLLLPDLAIKTQDVSGWSGKGLHTTTFTEMYDLPFGGSIVDTPGMREFALMDIEPVELSHYFTEMKPLIGQCRFNNCLHNEEPDCTIKNAAAEGKINIDRYISYLNILDSIEKKKY
ncbi:MAG: ribosome small subunit-dependent GTPase A [Chitinophagaceae bacterium]|nr:ribosome small subunit-dependent GTPase A [Chitinophagaceae bacterium]